MSFVLQYTEDENIEEENDGPFRPHENKRVEVLRRRAAYLTQRIVNEGENTSPWNGIELDALNWALRAVTFLAEEGLLEKATELRRP